MKKIVICLALLGLPIRAQSRTDLVQELAHLYPHLSAIDLEEKIASNRTAFQFLRSFVAYYYSMGAREALRSDSSSSLSAIASEIAWCAGDPHIENFGTILDRDAVAHFRINDKDDAGPCPTYLDTLRFLVSLRLGIPEVTEEEIDGALKTYHQGLKGESYSFSENINGLVQKAARKGPKAKNNLADERRKENGRDLSDDEMAALKSTVATEYGANTEVVGAFAFRPTSGGSSHLLRFRAELVFVPASPLLPTDAERHQIIEFKTIVMPGVYPASPLSSMPSASSRFSQSFSIDEGEKVAPLFRVVGWGAGEMILRPRWAGHIGVDLEDFETPGALTALVRDEAYVLGDFHRKSVSAAYIARFADAKAEDWLSASQILADKIQHAHALSRTGP